VLTLTDLKSASPSTSSQGVPGARLKGASRFRFGHRILVAAAALATGLLWMSVVPPFEGPDELFFYNEARRLAEQPELRENLLFRLATPIVRATATKSGLVEPESNPAFRFVSNEKGEVNRWAHDRRVASRDHVRTLNAVRVMVVVLSVLTALFIDGVAALCLPNPQLRWIVVAIAVFIPQVSFMNAVVQREAITALLGALTTLVVVARATGHLNRWVGWASALGVIALVPMADRQAYFLVPFAGLALVAAEQTWRARAVAVVAAALPATAAAWLVSRWIETGTDLGPWMRLIAHPVQPFTAGTTRGAAPGLAYYVYEFVPKLFMGFWGWLGQPSLLLPAPVYAALAVLCAFAFAGLLVRLIRHRSPSSEDERRRLLARRLMATGVVLMAIPIVYGPALAGLNLWYGHWLFPMLGPIAIGIVIGIAEIADLIERWPRRVAAVAVAVALVLAALWFSPYGNIVRTGIMANHYGDRERLIATIRDSIVILSAIAAAIALLARKDPLPWRFPLEPAIAPAIGAANFALLLFFVAPLYAPLTPADYVRLVEKYLAHRELTRAADVYASALKSHPNARELVELADESPQLLFGGRLEDTIAFLDRRLAHGLVRLDRDALFGLAARLRDANWTGSAALDAVLADADRDPDRAEAAALVRLELGHGARNGPEAVAPIDLGHGRWLRAKIRNETAVEGVTLHPLPEGTQVVLYVRPASSPDNRRFWIHAYVPGSREYLTIEPTISADRWEPGQLVWQVYDFPKGQFFAYVGQWVGSDMGSGTPIGGVP